jgi:hypothetical protein
VIQLGGRILINAIAVGVRDHRFFSPRSEC